MNNYRRADSIPLSAVLLSPPSRLELEEESSFSDLEEEESSTSKATVDFF
jgi:hypothetical protein